MATGPPTDGDRAPSLANTDFSFSSSSSSNRTEDTPPSPVAISSDSTIYNQPGVLTPQVRTTHIPVSGPQGLKDVKRPPTKRAITPRSGTITPRSRLGAIDEDSDNVHPDTPGLPSRNPRRLLGVPIRPWAFAFRPQQPSAALPKENKNLPRNIYDDIKGPNGENFTDVRNNNETVAVTDKRSCWRRRMWYILGFITAAIIVVIVVLAVELSRDRRSSSSRSASGAADSDTSFPTGQYNITTALLSPNTSCTSDPSTWSCYPDADYNTSTTAAVTSIFWTITSTPGNDNGNGYNYYISASSGPFQYTFANEPLTLAQNGTDNAAYTFSYTYRKLVIPKSDISSTNTAARCYYNNTLLTGTLYTSKPADLSMANSSGQYQPWPHALEFTETVATDSNEPECYAYTNGQEGARIPLAAATAGGQCECRYANYGL